MYLFVNLLLGAFFGLLPAVVLCLLAGRWDVWNAWAAAGIFLTFATVQALAFYRQSPALLKARVRPDAGGRVRVPIAIVFVVMYASQWIIAGLDQRFNWSNIVPPSAVVGGIVIFVLGWGLFTWSSLVNPFFTPEVRIQAERGHRVILDGPYAIVRHPGYAANLLAVLATGPALNSLLAIIPAVIFAAVVVQDTAIEDRMLQAELAGYADYAAKVRYRLVRGLW